MNSGVVVHSFTSFANSSSCGCGLGCAKAATVSRERAVRRASFIGLGCGYQVYNLALLAQMAAGPSHRGGCVDPCSWRQRGTVYWVYSVAPAAAAFFGPRRQESRLSMLDPLVIWAFWIRNSQTA